jgi:GNAT superfamily N-acetyltransferase
MEQGPDRALALNVAGWMDVSVRALGIETHFDETLWWCSPGAAPTTLAAVITDPHAPLAELQAALALVTHAWGSRAVALWDCSASLDLRPSGFERTGQNPWYQREPGPMPPLGSLPRLEFEVVHTAEQLARFERANFAANGFDALLERAPLTVHAAATLDDPGAKYIMGRLDGEVVTSSVAYISDTMVGVYGIATNPRFRRRGYGTALVREIVGLRHDLHVSTWPAPESVPMYTPFGFDRAGEVASWRSSSA